jgi:hypothetical protein
LGFLVGKFTIWQPCPAPEEWFCSESVGFSNQTESRSKLQTKKMFWLELSIFNQNWAAKNERF